MFKQTFTDMYIHTESFDAIFGAPFIDKTFLLNVCCCVRHYRVSHVTPPTSYNVTCQQTSIGKVTMMLNVGSNETDYHTPNLGHKRFDGTWKVMIISYLSYS